MNLKITKKFKKKFDKLSKYNKLLTLKELLSLPEKIDSIDYQGEDKMSLKEVKNISKEKYSEIFWKIKEDMILDVKNNLIYPSESFEDNRGFLDIVTEFVENIKNDTRLNLVEDKYREQVSEAYSFDKQLRDFIYFNSEKDKTLKKAKEIFEKRISSLEQNVKTLIEDIDFFRGFVNEKITGIIDRNFKKMINFNYEKLDKVLVTFIISKYLDDFIVKFHEVNNSEFEEIYYLDGFKDEIFYVKECNEDSNLLELEKLI